MIRLLYFITLVLIVFSTPDDNILKKDERKLFDKTQQFITDSFMSIWKPWFEFKQDILKNKDQKLNSMMIVIMPNEIESLITQPIKSEKLSNKVPIVVSGISMIPVVYYQTHPINNNNQNSKIIVTNQNKSTTTLPNSYNEQKPEANQTNMLENKVPFIPIYLQLPIDKNKESNLENSEMIGKYGANTIVHITMPNNFDCSKTFEISDNNQDDPQYIHPNSVYFKPEINTEYQTSSINPTYTVTTF